MDNIKLKVTGRLMFCDKCHQYRRIKKVQVLDKSNIPNILTNITLSCKHKNNLVMVTTPDSLFCEEFK